MTIHSLVKSRHQLAENFTKDFQDQVKQNLKDYKAEDSWLNSFADDNKLYTNVTKRYEIIIPMIFTTHEGMIASMFDRVPDLLFSQGGIDDEEKAKIVKASYEYLKRKADLESFMNTSAWWYILTGFLSAHVGYVKKGNEVQATDEMGEPMFDEMGEPINVMVYDYDDPEITVDDPYYTYFGPESKFSINADEVPYYTRTKLMTVEDIERTYGVRVEPDSTLKDHKNKSDYSTKDSEIIDDDLERSKVIMYYGKMHEDVAEELMEEGIEYDTDGWYYVVSTRDQLLHIERTPKDMKTCRLLKWYGVPTEFFGFGVAKLLRPFQKEKSLRRTQQARYADIAAFPKLLVTNTNDVDEMAITDPREVPTITYSKDEGEPKYISPPDMSNTLVMSEQKADEDAQKASGMLDIGQGAQQSNTVDTATGQAIFAEASEKRIRFAKKKFMQFYKECVVLMLKMAQIYWDEEKIISITDDQGNDEQVTLTRESLKDIDFDTDVYIDPDSITINKDVLRAQSIELYNTIKDDPLVERKEVFKDLLRTGFNKKNPDNYIKDMNMQPGMVLVNPETGEQFQVDETGEVVPMQVENELAPDAGGIDVPTDQAGVMGQAQQV